MAPTIQRTDSAPTPAKPINPIPSSSPAFGTPVHPLNPHRTAPVGGLATTKPTVLPILLPPATLRPLAFRTFTKKHNLTLTSSSLSALAVFIGRHCGSKWREEGLAEHVLEEVAKAWKRGGGQVIVDGEGEMLKGILKTLEGGMVGGRIVQGKSRSLSRQGSFIFGRTDSAPSDTSSPRLGLGDSQSSFSISNLELEDEDVDGGLKDPREWMKVIEAFEQPKLVYNVGKKHFEKSPIKPSFFPPPSHKTELFRQRYHLVHQRVLRNEAFQSPTFSGLRASFHRASSFTQSQTNKITPIANLLGRSGTDHLLLGLLTISPTGTLALSDLTGSIALDLQHARPIPEDGAWFAPGMVVLVDGTYEEDYNNLATGSTSALGNTGGIGGTIGGKFMGFSIGHPPCERRSTTLGIMDSVRTEDSTATGPAFGWTDFLGLGSERATGARMRRLERKILGPEAPHSGNGKIVIASEVNLDNPTVLTALRSMLATYAALQTSEYPMAIVLMGNFVRHAAMAGAPRAGSIEYKEYFDSLASVLAEYPTLIAHTTLLFVPGDNDAWSSAFSGGAAAPLPRKGVPDLFTSRIRRAVAEANREAWGGARKGGKEGEAVWTSNPSRLTWLGCRGEMVLMRDDVTGRLRRTAVRFRPPQPQEGGLDEEDSGSTRRDSQRTQAQDDEMELDPSPPSPPQPQLSDHPRQPNSNGTAPLDPATATARRLTKTLLDQSHLSPFPLSIRPQHWDYAHALSLYPLPTALVVADAEAPAFALTYFGCAVMNPGRLVDGAGERRGEVRWVEFDVLAGRGRVRGVEV